MVVVVVDRRPRLVAGSTTRLALVTTGRGRRVWRSSVVVVGGGGGVATGAARSAPHAGSDATATSAATNAPAVDDHRTMMPGSARRDPGQSARQPLLDREHRGEQIADVGDAFEHVGGLEAQLDVARRRAASTSSHDTGVDTVGSGLARSEYGAIVVLWWAFWLQSTKIFPGRWTLAIVVVTSLRQLPLEHLADGEGEVGRAARA